MGVATGRVGIPVTPVRGVVSPSYRQLRTYPSEMISGLRCQNKFSLEIVADGQNRLFYGIKPAEEIHRAFHYHPLPGGISPEQLQRSHLEGILAEIVTQRFGDQVEPALARNMNYSLYKKLEKDLLRARQ